MPPTPGDTVQALLEEGDTLLEPAWLKREQAARERLYVVTNELCNDHHYNGAALGRRWDRDRRTISVWKRKGAQIRRSPR